MQNSNILYAARVFVLKSWEEFGMRLAREVLALSAEAMLIALVGSVVKPLPARASVYRDNPDYIIDRRQHPEFGPIGELESIAWLANEKDFGLHTYGTAVLISPCYIITNHHVIFGDDLRPVPGRDYSMKFRVGLSTSPDVAFLGNTIATPFAWGERGAAHTDDWAILKLKTCVGARQDIGWMEPSSLKINDLVGKEVAVAGFRGDRQRGILSFSIGQAHTIDRANGFLRYSATAVGGQSGGAVMVRENGEIKLVGMHTTESQSYETGTNIFNTYSDRYSNEFISIQDIISRPDIRMLLDEDIATHGVENSARQYMKAPWPKPRRND